MESMSSKSHEETEDGNCHDDNDLPQEGNVNSNCDVGTDGIQQANVDSEREKNADGIKNIKELTVEDILSLEFDSEYDAWDFYRKYAKCHGFAIRKNEVDRDDRGNILMRELVCNKAGLRHKKHLMREDRKREQREITRTNCKARLRVRLNVKTQKWKVSNFVESHNHALSSVVEYVHLRTPNRSMVDAEKAQVESSHLYGVRSCRIRGFMLGRKGGRKDLGFCKKDLYSPLDRQRRAKIEDEDAFATLCYLQAKADNDPMQFIKFTTTDDGKLCNLFWSDSGSQTDFQCFGDVVAFDMTYKNNVYNKPLIIFSGSNHHGQTTIFAGALVADEKTETYKWVLEAFLEAMGNKHPQVVVTDGDDTMRDAIKAVFPNAVHRLCALYLHNSACRNIKNPEFLEDFEEAIYSNFTPAGFEDYWKNMTRKYGLANNEWIWKTYANKEMWATAYIHDKFFSCIQTTSICEGINSYIAKYVSKTNSLVDLMHNFERAVREYRNKEAIADLNSMSPEPVMTTALQEIERCAAKIYTRQIFWEVKAEIEDVAALNIVEKTGSGDNVVFKLNRFGKPGVEFEVKYDKTECKFSCDCRLFESRGIPCSHIFCCLKREHIVYIPSSLICKRWTKSAKSDFIASSTSESNDSDASFALRFGALSVASNRLCQLAAKDVEKFSDILGEINKLTGMLEERCRINSNLQIASPSVIGDPTVVKTKGAHWKRKYGGRMRQCSNSGGSGTNSNGEDVTSSSDDDIDDDVSVDNRGGVSHYTSDCVRQKYDGEGATSSKRKQQKVKISAQNSVNESSDMLINVTQRSFAHVGQALDHHKNIMTAEVTNVNMLRPATPIAPRLPICTGFTVYPHWPQAHMYPPGCWDGRLPQVQHGIHNGPRGNFIPGLLPADRRNLTPEMQQVDRGNLVSGVHNVHGGNISPQMQYVLGMKDGPGKQQGEGGKQQQGEGGKQQGDGGKQQEEGGSAHKNV